MTQAAPGADDAPTQPPPHPAAPAAAVPPTPCSNCGAPMLGPFCYACGQPVKGLIRQFSSILGDFFDTVLSLDSRTFRTLGPLYFKPGFLSNEYFAGRRVRYVTPLRMYFFLSVLAFLVIAAIADVGRGQVHLGDRTNPKVLARLSPSERAERLAAFEKALAFVPEIEREKAKAELERKIADVQAADAAAAKDGRPVPTEDEDDDKVSFNDKPWDAKANPVRLDWLSDGLNAALNVEIGELIGKIKGLSKDPGPFFKQIFSLAPQALFLILPLFALLLKVFYIFKRRLYMEHLIVALHSHSFICLSLVLVITLSQLKTLGAGIPVLSSVLQVLLVCAWLWIPLYVLLMQKRVYRQGWVLTGLKFFAVGIFYVILLFFGMLATMLVSLILL